jgi:hypothetical protein
MSVNRGFTAVCVKPKLYWTPKKPTFIIKIDDRVSSGLRSSGSDVSRSTTSDTSVTAIQITPSAAFAGSLVARDLPHRCDDHTMAVPLDPPQGQRQQPDDQGEAHRHTGFWL